MAGHETWFGFEWLYTTLSNDSTLTGYAPGGVWRGLAPPGTVTPYVVLVFQAGVDVITANAFRIMDDLLFQVKAVGPGNESAAIVNAASRVDALIGSPPTSGAVTGGTILSCNRQSPFQLDELVNGELWMNMGGMYRLIVEQGP